MSHPLFIITYHHHPTLNMFKTLVMLFQMIGLHGCNILPYLSREFVVSQVFNSKSDLQEAAKIYSIKANQEFVVVASLKKLLVLRCKKAEECQCPWKLRVMLVKDTCLFVINKYKRMAYLCQSLLESGSSSNGLKLGYYSYQGNY